MASHDTVLIVEDDPVFRRVLSFTVSKMGIPVETANDGKDGFERLIQGGISFIVTDYQMPGCDGIEMLRRLDQVENYSRPHTILCTAKGLELDAAQLRREFDLVAILHKPFSPRKLSDLLVEHLSPIENRPERSKESPMVGVRGNG